jgi:hypothetical protein
MEEGQAGVMKGRLLVRVSLPRVRARAKVLDAGRITSWIHQSVLGLVGRRVSLEVSEKVK